MRHDRTRANWTLLAICLLIILALAATGTLGKWAQELGGPAGIWSIAIGGMLLGTVFVKEGRDGQV